MDTPVPSPTSSPKDCPVRLSDTGNQQDSNLFAYYADDIVMWEDTERRIINFGIVHPYMGSRFHQFEIWPPKQNGELKEDEKEINDKSTTSAKDTSQATSSVDCAVENGGVNRSAKAPSSAITAPQFCVLPVSSRPNVVDISAEEFYDEDMASSLPQKGNVMVHFVLGNHETDWRVDASQLQLIDRESLILGDEVRHIPSGRCGRIRAKQRRVSGWVPNYNVFIHDALIDVDQRCRLQPSLLYGYNDRDVVFLGSWMGVVYEFKYDVTLLFCDGARCRVPESLLLGKFTMIRENRDVDDLGDIFEGQIITGDLRTLRSKRQVKFLNETSRFSAASVGKLKSRMTVECLVEELLLAELRVRWTTSRHPEESTPPTVLRGKMLDKVVLCRYPFGDCAVNSMMYMRPTAGDVLYVLKKHQTKTNEKETPKLEEVFYHLFHQDNEWLAQHMDRIPWPSGFVDTNRGSYAHSSHLSDSGVTTASSSSASQPSRTHNWKKTAPRRERVVSTGAMGFHRTSANYSSHSRHNERERVEESSTRLDEALSPLESLLEDKNSVTHVSFPMSARLLWMKERLRRCQDFNTCTPSTKVTQSSDGLLPLHIVASRSMLSVHWQDGTITEVPVEECEPIMNSIDEHQFYPGDMVMRKKDFQPEDGQVEPVFGMVLAVNAMERTCSVQWFAHGSDLDTPHSLGVAPTSADVVKYGVPEQCVVYELLPHALHMRFSSICILEEPEGADPLMGFARVLDTMTETGQLRVVYANGVESTIFPTQIITSSDDLLDSLERYDSTSEDSYYSFWETDEEEEIAEFDAETKEMIRCALKHLQRASVSLCSALLKSSVDTAMLHDLESWFTASSITSLANAATASPSFATYSKVFQPSLTFLKEARSHLKKAKHCFLDVRVQALLDDLNVFKFVSRFITQLKQDETFRAIGIASMGQDNVEQLCQRVVELFREMYTELVRASQNELEVCMVDLQRACSSASVPLTTDKEEDANASKSHPSGKDEDDGSLPMAAYVPPTLNGIRGEPLLLVEGEDGLLCVTAEEAASLLHKDTPNKFPPPDATQIQDPPEKNATKPPLDPTTLTSQKDNLLIEEKLVISEEENVKEEIVLEETTPPSPSTIACSVPGGQMGDFKVLEEEPTQHFFFNKPFQASNQQMMKAVFREHHVLSSSLPPGVWVRTFQSRADLFSVMIAGPSDTPYEYCLFFFDLRLSPMHPLEPPEVHYYAFSDERINPNLYVEGKVCLSLLGTWHGTGSENWNPKSSTLSQLLISIQGLILVPDPWYNEAGFDACRRTREGVEQSRLYNETILIMLTHGTRKLLHAPISLFREEIRQFYSQCGKSYLAQLEQWLRFAESHSPSASTSLVSTVDTVEGATSTSAVSPKAPKFALAPVSRGFVVAMEKALSSLRKCLEVNAYIETQVPQHDDVNIITSSVDNI